MGLIPINNNSLKQEKYRLFGDYYANDDQRIAIDKITDFLKSSNKSFVLTGAAGSGKTTILKKSLRSTGLKVFGATISHQAKTVLGSSIGHEFVFTIASLLGIKLNEETGKFSEDPKAKPRIYQMTQGVLVIDETSMVTKEIMNAILLKSPSKLKIIWVGDPNQLPPIGYDSGISPSFELYRNKNGDSNNVELNRAELTQIMRFGDVISSVASEISKGIIDPTLVELKRENNYNSTNKEGIIFINDEYETLIMASNDFKLNPKSTKLITYNNHKNSQPQSVLNLNIKIRELIYPNATSPIMPNEVFTLYNPFMDKDNDEKILAQNSESFVVKTYHKKTKEINISVYSHKMGRREFNAKYVDVFQSECVFDNKNLDLELIFDPQYKKDLSDIAKTADWQLFYSLQKQFPQIEYGYCITTHRAQGSGYDNIYIFEDNIVSSPQTSENIYRTFYTAVTRAKKKLVIQSLWN